MLGLCVWQRKVEQGCFRCSFVVFFFLIFLALPDSASLLSSSVTCLSPPCTCMVYQKHTTHHALEIYASIEIWFPHQPPAHPQFNLLRSLSALETSTFCCCPLTMNSAMRLSPPRKTMPIVFWRENNANIGHCIIDIGHCVTSLGGLFPFTHRVGRLLLLNQDASPYLPSQPSRMCPAAAAGSNF